LLESIEAMIPAAKDWQIVFLFGLQRSGTTWVGKIFDSHPQTLYKHEPDTFSLAPNMPWAPDVSQTDALRPVVNHFLSQLPNVNTSFVAGSLPVFRKAYRSGWQHSAHLVNVLTAKLSRRVFADFAIDPWFDGDGRSAPLLVCKSITSLGRLGVFLRVARRRKAIVLMRHPCGVIASLKRGRAQGLLRNDASSDYPLFEELLNTGPGRRYGTTIDDLRTMRPEERLAWKWILVYEKVLEDIHGIEDAVLVVRYEDVCADPKRWARKMFALCGLSWHPQTEAFVDRSTAEPGGRFNAGALRRDYFSVFKDPTWSAGKWRDELAPEEVERVSRILRGSPLHRFYPSTLVREGS
jgi:hypothetical protein